ncbi:hypothetical protein KEHDKFFH_18420 [Marinobacter maroccanus]|uniref:Uncharacterized protein n=1 Tax=Marinobacter maroccanus TaxID=2055143 RepID=A0A2S5Z5Q8_9GAMM|nr:hypothetical protein [Marinobacter maroccanus]PPI82696.1 hypothetical protein KEHDKFFH_18420 [Marinobacter maroccanus]
MIRQHSLRLWLLLCTMAAALIISGCGGGSSSGSGTTPTTDDSATISGTAAAGAPVSGIVGARDASGDTLTTTIETDGSFELDLSGLDTPVLLYASGIAGGNAYQMLSVAFADDLNGTANITPLTDLIVGNAVGRSPQEFFNNPDFDLIQQAAIETEEAALKTRLKPLLDALGVEEDFDLRSSPFTANRSGFDAALDVIEVQIDPGTNTATITNRVNRTQTITNNFVQPESEETTLEVDETEINEGVTTLQALNTLATSFADALEGQDETTLESLTSDFLNNGETIGGFSARLSGSPEGIEDAGELAEDIRDWSVAELGEGTARLNVGQAQGPWQAINDGGDWKLQGNRAEFFVFVEPTHRYENGADSPLIEQIATLIYAGFPSASLGSVADSSVTVSGDLENFNGDLPIDSGNNRFADFQGLAAGSISSGDQVTFAWNNPVEGIVDSIATFTIRRGSPDFSNGAPEITAASADLAADEYSFQWTLPPGYDAVSVRNNFTGQTSGGQGGGFTGNPLANDATSFTGELPANYVPRETDQLRLIARDPFGVFVAARLNNPFAEQVPAPSEAGALVGSFIKRNTDRTDNAPWVHFTFFESGQYIHLELGDDFRPDADPNGNTGMEMGTYTWNNQTGDFEFTGILIDQNGEWGASDLRAEETPLRVEADSDGFTLNFANGDSLQFDRVPANSATGGVAGTWATQNPANPDEVAVLTLLEDGFYFIGDAYDASGDEVPGIEFGEWTWDSESLILDYITEYDQNGVAGLANNGAFNGEYVFTVIDGQLVVDEDEPGQLSELFAGNPVSDGELTVDYTPPGNDTGSPGTAGPAVTGDVHYLRTSIGIESSRVNNPPTVFQAHYAHIDANIVDNADGTGTLSWSDLCVGDLLIDPGTSEDGRDALFDSVSECFGQGNGFDLSFTETGLFAAVPESTTIDPEDNSQIITGATEIDFRALDAERSLFIANEANSFQYEESDGSFTEGRNMNTHVLSKTDPTLTVDSLAGDWGFATLRISNIVDDADAVVPNEMEYGAGALNISVDAAGNATLTDEVQLNVGQGLKPLVTSDVFVDTRNEETALGVSLGAFGLTADGTLDLLSGELGGFVSQGSNVMTLGLPNPFTPYEVQTDESSFLIGVKLDPNFQSADLAGKSYDLMLKGYFAGQNYFETDIFLPGATLEFDGSGTATSQRGLTFAYSNFGLNTDVVDVTRQSAGLTPNNWTYQVDTSTGLIRMESPQYTYSGGDVGFGEQFGYSSADNRLLVLVSRFYDNSGGTPMGPAGAYIAYAICNNCD